MSDLTNELRHGALRPLLRDEAADAIDALRTEVEALKALLRDVHYDLLIRAQFRDGMKVVDLSSTTWIRLCDALKPAESLTKEA